MCNTLINEYEIITFGKHKSANIYDIIDSYPSYCLWLLKQPFLENYTEIKKILEDVFTDKEAIYLHFGRHKNRSLSWIKTNDPKYLHYLRGNEYVITKCPKIIEFIEGIKAL